MITKIEVNESNISGALEILKWYCGDDDARQPVNPIVEYSSDGFIRLGSNLELDEDSVRLMYLESDSLGDDWDLSRISAIQLIDWLNKYVVPEAVV